MQPLDTKPDKSLEFWTPESGNRKRQVGSFEFRYPKMTTTKGGRVYHGDRDRGIPTAQGMSYLLASNIILDCQSRHSTAEAGIHDDPTPWCRLGSKRGKWHPPNGFLGSGFFNNYPCFGPLCSCGFGRSIDYTQGGVPKE